MASCQASCGSDDGIIKANPDIAGIGVIASFFSTTCLAVLLAIIIQLLDGLTGMKKSYKRWLRIPKRKRRMFLSAIFSKVLLGLNDSQLFTGTAVQIVAIIQHCSISVYHFQIITELAFLSTITHLLTLIALRSYFVQNRKSNVPRAFVMVLNLALLGYTSWVGYAFEMSPDASVKSSRVICVTQSQKSTKAVFYVRWLFLLSAAIAGHLSILIPIYLGIQPSGRISKAIFRRGVQFRNWILAPAYTIYGLVNASLVLRNTQAWNRHPPVHIEGSERDFGFGQILALLLLALFLLPGWETFFE
ncbi:hypothetical protein BDV96DRAFT_611834 [Lophiotrema nucula]|uniref:Uncharacterized protein n=1 Tax=Lophiotrema nucula TaxID=690887 RepID=A0A6A5ZBU2_9PLEO|nr:hypothetical protein BDV96DRAFT_611834 [Lophiotrema nucula]